MRIQYKDRETGQIKYENPPAEGLLRIIYDHPIGERSILPLVRRKFISEWYGRQMDRPSSVRRIKKFIDQMNIDMSESIKEVDEFKTFNAFFYRKLKPSARPIGEGLVSPGDGRLLAFSDVNEIKSFFIKGEQFTLNTFLQNDQLAEEFDSCALVILRLAPNDYHRFHFPYTGIPSELFPIQGNYLSVSPYALAKHFTRVFCENKRAYCLLETERLGKLIIAPVGATLVGGIVETYTPNKKVVKGDEMGYFKFGGSTIVMLLEKGHFVLDQDVLDNTSQKLETFVKMGERIGLPMEADYFEL